LDALLLSNPVKENLSVKKFLAVLILSATATLSAADFSLGIQIGAPPPPRVVRVHPRSPGPDYVWLDGYWYPEGGRYKWHNGYWTRPPYAGALWVGPHYDGGRYYEGFWQGNRGQIGHDHRWDRGHDRDYHH
jgi:WXXGXW repeat (2 copies)